MSHFLFDEAPQNDREYDIERKDCESGGKSHADVNNLAVKEASDNENNENMGQIEHIA